MVSWQTFRRLIVKHPAGLGWEDLKPVISKTFAFDDIVEAYRYLESNEQFGKVVVSL